MNTTMNRIWAVSFVALLTSGIVGCVTQSSNARYDGAMTFTVENDVLTGSDSNYTNGVGATWSSNELGSYDDDRFVSKWVDFWSFLPFVADEGYDTYAAWSVAQEMHTPDDITNPDPPLDDQPYAGILYLDNVLYAKSELWTHTWSLRVGLVGPDSQADDVQDKFHDWFGGDEPMGWHTQMPNEMIVNVDYTAGRMLAGGDLGESASWRMGPVFTAGLGTYFTGAGAGLYGEVGWNLVEALGGTALREGFNAASTVGAGPVDGWSVGFSGGLMGYGVAHYLPLDGTVFRDSRSVDSEPAIGMATLGFTVRHGIWVGALTWTFFTDTFETERENPEFGTLSLSWYF